MLDQNLQTILDRYSMMGEDYDPTRIDVTNADGRYMHSLGPRKGRLYGELTSYGLALVWADADTTQYSRADVLVIDDSFAIAGSHIYNRQTGEHDWHKHTGSGAYTSISLASHADVLTTMPLLLATASISGARLEKIQTLYERTAMALAKFAIAGSEHDALHQIVATRKPLVHKNLEQLYPYAGRAYGPRVNLQEMITAGVEFHPAVAEALQSAPGMMIDS